MAHNNNQDIAAALATAKANVRDARKRQPTDRPPTGDNTMANPYVKAAVLGDIAELSRASDGTRNDELNKTALRCARLLADEPNLNGLRDMLTQACRDNGLMRDRTNGGSKRIDKTINSAFDKAQHDGPAPMPEAYERSGTDCERPAVTHSDEPADDDTPLLAQRILTRSALRSLPTPEPLIDNVLDRGTMALLYGPWSTGKTFVALDWAASVATGRSWQARPVYRCRVLYVVAEGAYGFNGRIEAWETGWHTALSDGDLDVLPEAVNLTRWTDVAQLCELVTWAGYEFVVLDTLSRCMVGADENSAKDCGIAVDAMQQIRLATPGQRGTVLGIHHTGKDQKTFRGSSVFEAAADTVYSTQLDGHITLQREKRKDGPQLDVHSLRFDPVPGTDSLTLAAYRDTSQPDRPTAQALLAVFTTHFSATGASKTELRDVADMPLTSFKRALNDLVAQRVLVNVGTDKQPFYRLSGTL